MASKILWLAALLAAGTSHTAQAAYVDYTASVAAAATPLASSITLQKFDPSLGLLTGISLSFTSSVIGHIDVYNATSAAIGFTNAFAAIPVTITIGTPDALTLTTTASYALASGTAAPGFNSFSGAAINGGMVLAAVAPGDFSTYLGPGVLTASFATASGDGSFGGTARSGLFFSGSADAGGDVRIRYDYEALAGVPLPPSVWLMGSGLLTLGLMVTRRRLPTT